MRLSSIKLAGFKSFVDPTTFGLPGQLVGVVGPNGCGKSNIIDAVRWVLGESRASELRGESMQDVIFNGSTLRKPASRASVELVFDNTDHRAGGQWNQYEEIAVRRVLTRDGNSSYFINNIPVRRRDVQDVFLGTGLGPRAYAIIGQGTISRIIESRPEELRLFLEEAAGVSKYKERRRETENRLNDTRENLTRVDDILRELNSNLDKLEKQAVVAQKYQDLKADIQLKQNLLWFFKRADSQAEQSRLKAEVDQAGIDLEARMAELRSIESDLETIRQNYYAAGEQVNQSQASLYEATAEVARLEAEIRYVVEGRTRVEQRILVLNQQSIQWTEQIEQATLDLNNLHEEAEKTQEQAAILSAQLEDHDLQLPDLDTQLKQAQQVANDQRSKVQQLQQQIGLLAAEQRHIEEQSRQLSSRQQRLFADKNAVVAPEESKLHDLELELELAQEELVIAEAQLEQLQEQLPGLEEQKQQQQQLLQQELSNQAQLNAKLLALRNLQDKLKVDEKLSPWLEKHGLQGLTPLWNLLHIEPGWENALEAALRERMSAFEVSQLEMISRLAADQPPSKMTFYSPANTETSPSQVTGMQSLLQLIKLHDSQLKTLLSDWLQNCWVANNLQEALALRQELQSGHCIYVPQGHAVTRSSVSFYAADSEQAGLLARSQEIERLDKETRAQHLIVEETKIAFARHEAQITEVQQSIQQARLTYSRAQTKAHDFKLQVMQLAQQVDQAKSRSQLIDKDIAECNEQLDALAERNMLAQAKFEDLDIQLAESQERHVELEDIVIATERAHHAAREQQRDLERKAQEANFQHRTMVAKAAELERQIKAAQQQLLNIADEQKQAESELGRLTAVSAQTGLQNALDLRSQKEAVLAANRSLYDDLTAKLRACDDQRIQTERALDPMRQKIGELQLKEQAARLNFEQYHQQLLEAQANLEELAALVVSGQVRMTGLSSEIDRLQREVIALGAVNLAALDELGSARERKQFLDSQTADLQEAIHTLENAIKKIDAETRDLLSGTFNTVNEHFGRMFPELFGGGNAKLVITGDEILDAGVLVQAQPPGKKNQTIHLLSGGEKALTAIALVFAIFQLNPAPFCLLDEVDAPLDDSNTERYARLVAKMSSGTQFLFISHNKIAMEMAQQLIGVTMQEQGVSRIVAVDMESAVNLAQAV